MLEKSIRFRFGRNFNGERLALLSGDCLLIQSTFLLIERYFLICMNKPFRQYVF